MIRHFLFGTVCAVLLTSTPATAATRPIGTKVACINSRFILRQEPAGKDAVRYVMVGGETWLNRMRVTCPGLPQLLRFRTPFYEQRQGTNLCRGDLLRAVDPQTLGAGGPGAHAACVLGTFEKVADERPRRRR